jgi:hypothetical protein
MRAPVWFCFWLCGVLPACGSSNASSATEKDAGSDAAVEAAPDAPIEAAPQVDAGPVLRTVETRNPFGDLSREHNLLVDGDFELTAGQGQYGWQAIQSLQQVSVPRETGGLCRSGVSCGAMTRDVTLIAEGAAPAGKDLEISLWVKPPAPDCLLTAVVLANCDAALVGSTVSVPPVEDAPDATGWCHHDATLPKIDYRPCLVVSSFADADARTLIDEGGLYATTTPSGSSLAYGPLTPQLHERVSTALRIVREQRLVGRPPPSRP